MEDQWVSFCYYTDLESCVNGLIERLVRMSDGVGIEEYRVIRDNLISTFADALRPAFTVEVQELRVKQND
jgi:hypothetical protein